MSSPQILSWLTEKGGGTK